MTALYVEENVYNLIPKEVKEPIKQPRYISTFKPSVIREIRERKTAPCKTMGIPKLQVPTPREFLQKHSKEPKLPKRKRMQGMKKPLELTVPERNDHPIMGIHSEKNYIVSNIAEAIMAVAKKPLRACVDVRKGDKFLVDNSGLVKRYLHKKDFGVTPKYIKKQTKEAKKAQEETDACLQATLSQKGLTRLSREEREHILEGLKQNWEEINQEFQNLSVVLDSLPRKLRKEKMETQMKALEHDITVLEKHKVVYIAKE
ncbi:enkurin-like [Rhineura floridana]|uniref:enkurin-like n=1 Tax=Rhineura floridana TaxID=261503 RepID=UPI002AC8039A|nr:enkurin-like [Rhineura floridana]XP_061441563.1 enkurin-like [Rhineura floridana]XP_061441564.1 enkurin-like [Rhineura floridana]XP_061441565.1 enkurin-like [Rhineura floridana]